MSISSRTSFQSIPLYSPSGHAKARIDLSDNTNLFGVPPAAERVLRDTVAAGISRYPQLYSPDLRRIIAGYAEVAPEQIATGCGSDDVIDSTLRAFLDPGETLAYQDPTFVMLPLYAKLNALKAAPVPLKADYDIDAEGLLATGAKVIYLCTPNNPTGTVASRTAVERVVDGAPGLVIIDEAYAEFARDTFLDLARSRPNVLVMRTMSKAFGLAGIRVGYAVGSAALVAEVEKARGPYKVTSLAERMAAATLLEDVPWMRALATEALSIRERLRGELETMGLRALPSEANFLLVPLPGAPQVAARMREREVNVRAFQGLTGIGDALRIGVGPWDMMEAALTALREALR
jgi:histidinol-phosphate aminotransferase